MNESKKYYRPLPSEVTIGESLIEGLGLFATQSILAHKNLGITHVLSSGFADGMIRTPLGGFVNYSEDPNCELQQTGDYFYLVTKQNLSVHEELTLKYNLYDPTE